MLEEDRNRIIDSIRRKIYSGSYRSRGSLYSDRSSPNVDHLVDHILAKHKTRQKVSDSVKKKFPMREILAVGVVLFVLLAMIPQLLPPLYGDFGSDVIINNGNGSSTSFYLFTQSTIKDNYFVIIYSSLI